MAMISGVSSLACTGLTQHFNDHRKQFTLTGVG
jgi:hypothetical protein